MEISIEVSRVQTGFITVDIAERLAEAELSAVELHGHEITGTFAIDADEILADSDEGEVDWETIEGLTLESVSLS